jgi:glycosyltransferase involved in cell wall biosynthesis
MTRKRILLIGPYPPPFGGVSVHIGRIIQKSVLQKDFEIAVFDLRKRKLFKSGSVTGLISGIIFLINSSVIHLHISNKFKTFIARIGKFLGKKIIYTHHNSRDLEKQKIFWISDKNILTTATEISIPNSEVIPAYIPPSKMNKPNEKILSELIKYKKIILTFGANNKSFIGKDIYGIDLVLDASRNFEGVLFVFVLDEQLKNKYQHRVQQLTEAGISLLIINEAIDIPGLLLHISVYIRAATSDGDSLIVREALQSGVTVVASDCVIRPEGCMIFKTGDRNDLINKLVVALESESRTIYQQPDFSHRIFEIYSLL